MESNSRIEKESARKIKFFLPHSVFELINKEANLFKISLNKLFNILIPQFGFDKLSEKYLERYSDEEQRVVLFNLTLNNIVFNRIMIYGKYDMASVFMRKIIATYISLPPDKRERIILRDAFSTIENAIEKGQRMKIFVNDKIVNVYPIKIEKCVDTGYNKLITKFNSYVISDIEILKIEKPFYSGALLMFGAFQDKITVSVNDILHNSTMIIDATPKVGKVIAAAGGTLLVGTVATNSVVEKIQEKKEYVKVIKRIEVAREKQSATQMLNEPLMVSNVDNVIDNLIALQAPLPEMILEKVTISEKSETIPYLKILEPSKIEVVTTNDSIKNKPARVIKKIKKQPQSQMVDIIKKSEPLEEHKEVKTPQIESEVGYIYIKIEPLEE